MGEFGWYPRDPAAYRLDTLHLTLAEHGAYNLLIDWYMEKRRPVPDSDRAICSILGVGLEEWLGVAVNVRALFVSRGGCLHQKRCDRELDTQDRRAKHRSSLAQKAANIRHGNIKDVDAARMPDASNGHADRNADAMPKHATETVDKDRDKGSKKERKKDAPNGAFDPVKDLFDTFVRILSNAGYSEERSRSLVGKWRKAMHGEDDKLLAFAAGAARATGPIAYVEQCIAKASDPFGPHPGL